MSIIQTCEAQRRRDKHNQSRKASTMTTATDITGHGRNYRYRGLQICRIDNTKARNWHVFGGHTGCAILFRCNSLESAQRYADARIETAARDAIAAAEAKLGKGHELTCQRAIHSLGWDQDGEQAEQLVRIYQGRA